jgi:very-short-patch-repair endonuclease
MHGRDAQRPAGGVWGRSAAVLHRAPDFRPGPIDVVTRHGTTHRSALASVHESRTVGRFVVVDGIRVVSKEDCTIQVARYLSVDRLRSLVGFFERHDRSYLAALRDRQVALDRSRLPGMRRLRLVLRELVDDDPPTESDLEIALRQLVASVPALGRVVWQAPLPFWTRGNARCDGLAIDWPLILEADGRSWHTRVEDFERDRERDNLANVHQHDVLRFTYDKLTYHFNDCRRMLIAYVAQRSGPHPAIRRMSAGSLAAG